ncbi:B12-binding domain-containing radical SAM protein [Candidatus Omnitrophota bacterium]
MRVFFVYLDVNNTQPVGYQVGLGYVASMVKSKGHYVKYFSPQTEQEIRALLNKIKKDLPEVIAFSCISTQFKYARLIAKEVRSFYDPKIICGGVHPTLMPECILDSEHIDVVARGEGEYAFIEYLELLEQKKSSLHIRNLWIRDGGSIIKNEIRPLIRNLDDLPFPDREGLDFQTAIDKAGFCSFIFSRGCAFDCYYCCNSILNKIYGSNYVRFRSAKASIGEIESVLSKYRVKDINFDDDNFTLNKEWFFYFIEKYKRTIKRKFICNVRVGTCTFEMFKLLREANCTRVRIGVESGDEQFRRAYLNRNMSNKQIIETFEMAHKAGLRTFSFNIIGFPNETPELFKKTISLNAQLHPNHPFLAIFYPYPKTHLRDLCEHDKLLIDAQPENRDMREREESVLNLPNFSNKEIIYYYKNMKYLVLKKISLFHLFYFVCLENAKRVLSAILNKIRKLLDFLQTYLKVKK